MALTKTPKADVYEVNLTRRQLGIADLNRHQRGIRSSETTLPDVPPQLPGQSVTIVRRHVTIPPLTQVSPSSQTSQSATKPTTRSLCIRCTHSAMLTTPDPRYTQRPAAHRTSVMSSLRGSSRGSAG
jgi:hypothetical protein